MIARVFIAEVGSNDEGAIAAALERALDTLGEELPGERWAGKPNWVFAGRWAADCYTHPTFLTAALDVLLRRRPGASMTLVGNSGLGVPTRATARRAGVDAVLRRFPGRVRFEPTDEARLARFRLTEGRPLTPAERCDPGAMPPDEARFWETITTSAVAHDAVCARILGLEPERVEHPRLAAARGHGPIQAARIEVLGDAAVETVARRMAGFGARGLIPVDGFPGRFAAETGRPFPLEIVSGAPYEGAGSQGILLDWLYMSYDHPRFRKRMVRWPAASVFVGAVDAYVRTIPQQLPSWWRNRRKIPEVEAHGRLRRRAWEVKVGAIAP